MYVKTELLTWEAGEREISENREAIPDPVVVGEGSRHVVTNLKTRFVNSTASDISVH